MRLQFRSFRLEPISFPRLVSAPCSFAKFDCLFRIGVETFQSRLDKMLKSDAFSDASKVQLFHAFIEYLRHFTSVDELHHGRNNRKCVVRPRAGQCLPHHERHRLGLNENPFQSLMSICHHQSLQSTLSNLLPIFLFQSNRTPL